MERLTKCLRLARSWCPCVRKDSHSFGLLVFDLWVQTDSEKIRPTKEFMPADEIQGHAEIVRIKHFDPLPEVRRKKSAVFEVAVEPERAGIKLDFIGSNAQLSSSNPELPRADLPAKARLAFLIWLCRPADSDRSDPTFDKIGFRLARLVCN